MESLKRIYDGGSVSEYYCNVGGAFSSAKT